MQIVISGRPTCVNLFKKIINNKHICSFQWASWIHLSYPVLPYMLFYRTWRKLIVLRKLRARVSCSGMSWRVCSMLLVFGTPLVGKCYLDKRTGNLLIGVVLGIWSNWVWWGNVNVNELGVARLETRYYYFFFIKRAIWRRSWGWDGLIFRNLLFICSDQYANHLYWIFSNRSFLDMLLWGVGNMQLCAQIMLIY